MTASASNDWNSNFHFAEMSPEFPADFGVLPIYSKTNWYYNDGHYESLGAIIPEKKAFYEVCKTIRHYSGGLPDR